MTPHKAICLLGPTASGKTAIAIALAKHFNGEIINLDSVQIYKELNIGSAKPSLHELESVKHHLVNIASINNPLSSYDIFLKSIKTINTLKAQNKNIIITGGTGLYYKSLLYGMFEGPSQDPEFRDSLKNLDAQTLYNKLQQVDKKSAESLHPNDLVRIERALEVFHLTGKSIKELQTVSDYTPPCEFLLIGILKDRTQLYDKINQRVDEMIANGLVDEVKDLYQTHKNARLLYHTIGYKEIIAYLKGEIALKDAIDLIKKHSRRYAKRQLTLFRNLKHPVYWKDPTDLNSMIKEIDLLFNK